MQNLTPPAPKTQGPVEAQALGSIAARLLEAAARRDATFGTPTPGTAVIGDFAVNWSEPGSMMGAALDLARRGYRVFPVHTPAGDGCSCGKRHCDSTGKHPRTRHGVKDATTDVLQIRAWWTEWPDANIGIACGDLVVVLDLDGTEAITEAVKRSGGALPLTPTVETGKGQHLYFAAPADQTVKNTAGQVGPGMDVRGVGGYVVAPPSLHHSGRRYRWAEGRGLEVPLAALPAWVLRKPEGKRNDALASEVGRLFASGLGEDAVRAAAHEWNAIWCDPPLSDREVDVIVSSISRQHAHQTAQDKAITEAIDRFNRRWALVLRGGNAVLETPARGEPQFHEYQRWKRFVSNELIEIAAARGTRKVPLVELWLGDPRRRSYHGVVFDPKAGAFEGVLARRGDDGDLDFNLWPGLAIQPSEEGSCARLVDHLRQIVCRGEEALFSWVTMWLAHIVQHPERLAGTALALRGPQGTGKSVVGEVMGTILGDALYAKVSKPDELTGRFNSHHQGRLLFQVEEGFWAGDKRAEGALKHMITSKVVMVEPKFVDAFPVENFMRLLVTSNKDWVVPAGFGERRFAVLDVSDARKEDRDYHEAMRRELFQDGGCARFLHYLLHEVTVDEAIIWRPPHTEALVEQQLESLSDEDTWLMDTLSNAELPGDHTGNGQAATTLVFRHYLEHSRNLGRTRRSAETKLGIYLRKKSPLGVYAVKSDTIDGKTRYIFPPLAACREAFAQKLARQIEWLVPAERWQKSNWGMAPDY